MKHLLNAIDSAITALFLSTIIVGFVMMAIYAGSLASSLFGMSVIHFNYGVAAFVIVSFAFALFVPCMVALYRENNQK